MNEELPEQALHGRSQGRRPQSIISMVPGQRISSHFDMTGCDSFIGPALGHWVHAQ